MKKTVKKFFAVLALTIASAIFQVIAFAWSNITNPYYMGIYYFNYNNSVNQRMYLGCVGTNNDTVMQAVMLKKLTAPSTIFVCAYNVSNANISSTSFYATYNNLNGTDAYQSDSSGNWVGSLTGQYDFSGEVSISNGYITINHYYDESNMSSSYTYPYAKM